MSGGTFALLSAFVCAARTSCTRVIFSGITHPHAAASGAEMASRCDAEAERLAAACAAENHAAWRVTHMHPPATATRFGGMHVSARTRRLVTAVHSEPRAPVRAAKLRQLGPIQDTSP
eukprot:gnl/Chilomastix_cuspidata/9775.p4 GENE.gnl/Chilomastix_cuspidata/9775~~gnl/Chilomastix_cuspidata/9775.p4  ORF type:complete len:118 (-),score=8.61 gnl/Chilomastix_cuspidata/9775:127-480(-)